MKKFLLPMLAVVFAFAMSAFTHQKKALLTDQAWFQYNGNNPLDQDSYSYYGESDPGCSDNDNLCAVLADIDPNTIIEEEISTSKPVETGTSRSLTVLASESSDFEEPTADVQMHN